MKNKVPFNIPSITNSLKQKVIDGEITIVDASAELYKAGWINHIDIDKTKEILGIK